MSCRRAFQQLLMVFAIPKNRLLSITIKLAFDLPYFLYLSLSAPRLMIRLRRYKHIYSLQTNRSAHFSARSKVDLSTEVRYDLRMGLGLGIRRRPDTGSVSIPFFNAWIQPFPDMSLDLVLLQSGSIRQGFKVITLSREQDPSQTKCGTGRQAAVKGSPAVHCWLPTLLSQFSIWQTLSC